MFSGTYFEWGSTIATDSSEIVGCGTEARYERILAAPMGCCIAVSGILASFHVSLRYM